MKRCSLALALSALLLGCGSSSNKKELQTPAPTPSTQIDPDSKTEAKPAAPKLTREEKAQQALARVPEILKGVALLRGLEFKQEVPAIYQNQEDFRLFVSKEIRKDLPSEKNIALGKALTHIGLIPHSLDLAKTLEDALVTQAGAYYDPKVKKFFLVMVPDSKLMLDTISSHELTHALQDQHFNLNTYYYGHDGDGPPLFNEDQLAARKFIVEGEATFIMMAYAAYSMSKINMLKDPKMAVALRPQLQMMANMSIAQLKEMNKQQAGSMADMGEDMKKSMDAMDDIPLYILLPLMSSYTKGALPVYEMYMAGGWDAVNSLYTTAPPESTEQVLHPKEKLFPKRDYPVSITLKSPKGVTPVYSEVMGELGWRAYFQVWNHKNANAVAAGWDGDRYAVWEKDGKLISATATIWDSKEEATEFSEAYLQTLMTRFPEGAPTKKGKMTLKPRTGGVIAVEQRGTEVWIADGSDAKAAIANLKKAKKRKLKKNKLDR